MESAEYALMDAAEDRMWCNRGLHARLLAALAGVQGRVLDAGCGTGGLLAYLRAQRPDLVLVGVERSEAAGRRAAAKSRVRVVRGSVNALPFGEACFDAALAADALCHRGPAGGARRTAAGAASGRTAGREHARLRLAAVGA